MKSHCTSASLLVAVVVVSKLTWMVDASKYTVLLDNQMKFRFIALGIRHY